MFGKDNMIQFPLYTKDPWKSGLSSETDVLRDLSFAFFKVAEYTPTKHITVLSARPQKLQLYSLPQVANSVTLSLRSGCFHLPPVQKSQLSQHL